MTLTPVESLPKRTINGRNEVEKLLKDFVGSGMKIARIDYYTSEYRSVNTLYSSVFYAIKRIKAPVRVHMRNRQVYLIRL